MNRLNKWMYLSGGSRISRWGGGGAEPLGGADLRRGCFSAKTDVKMKELDPVGGGRAPPGSANVPVQYNRFQ